MSASRMLLPFALLACSGCASPITNLTAPTRPQSWEELHLRYSQRLQKWRWGGGEATVDQPPAEALRISVRVDSVNVPYRNSALAGGEGATVIFSVPAGSIPFAPKCSRVLMRFDPTVNPFMEGSPHQLIFLPDGRFWGGGSFEF